jgi:hypothetical protein
LTFILSTVAALDGAPADAAATRNRTSLLLDHRTGMNPRAHDLVLSREGLLIRGGVVSELAAAGPFAAALVTDVRTQCRWLAIWDRSQTPPAAWSPFDGGAGYSGTSCRSGDLEHWQSYWGLTLVGSRAAWLASDDSHLGTDYWFEVADLAHRANARQSEGYCEWVAEQSSCDAVFLAGGDKLVFGRKLGTKSTLLRIVGRRAIKIRTYMEAVVPLSASGGRILARAGDRTLLVLGSQGQIERTLPFARGEVREARLSGRFLVIHTPTEIVVTDVAKGKRLRSWLVPSSAKLEDLEGARALYLTGRTLHLVSLATGRRQQLEISGSGIHAQLTSDGVVASHDARPAQVVFVPWTRFH